VHVLSHAYLLTWCSLSLSLFLQYTHTDPFFISVTILLIHTLYHIYTYIHLYNKQRLSTKSSSEQAKSEKITLALAELYKECANEKRISEIQEGIDYRVRVILEALQKELSALKTEYEKYKTQLELLINEILTLYLT